jgi:DNA-binding PadR family transcriptional regulator
MSASSRATRQPLTPVVFHVLLALGDGPLHGYAIMRRVEIESGVEMGPGTVYGSLNRLGEMGWVEETEDASGDRRRRRSFRMTEAGRAGLGGELARMAELAELARRRGLVPDEAR